jgi:hypothetical protein
MNAGMQPQQHCGYFLGGHFDEVVVAKTQQRYHLVRNPIVVCGQRNAAGATSGGQVSVQPQIQSHALLALTLAGTNANNTVELKSMDTNNVHESVGNARATLNGAQADRPTRDLPLPRRVLVDKAKVNVQRVVTDNRRIRQTQRSHAKARVGRALPKDVTQSLQARRRTQRVAHLELAAAMGLIKLKVGVNLKRNHAPRGRGSAFWNVDLLHQIEERNVIRLSVHR